MDLYDAQMAAQSRCMAVAERVQCWQAGHSRHELYAGCLGYPWTITDEEALEIWPRQFQAEPHFRTVNEYPYRNTKTTHVLFNFGVVYGMNMMIMELMFFLNSQTGRNELYRASATGVGGCQGWAAREFWLMKRGIRRRYGRSDYSTFDWSRWDYIDGNGEILARHTCSRVYPDHVKMSWFRMDVYNYLHGQSAAPVPKCMGNDPEPDVPQVVTRAAQSSQDSVIAASPQYTLSTNSSLDLNLPLAEPANDFLSVEIFERNERRPSVPGL